MSAIWFFLIAAIISRNYNAISGAPLTKWFKTDNNTYYIEEREKFTWQQSYDECQNKNMILITVKAYKEDELLLEYIKQSFDPTPEFWLKASDNVDLKNINQLLGSVLAENFLNIKLDGLSNPQIVESNNPDNCALTVDGTVKACETLHGYICHDYRVKGGAGGGQNVQNIVLKFN